MEKKSLNNIMQEDFHFLMKSKHYFSASTIGWNYILKEVSNICYNNKVSFNSTETALTGFFSISNDSDVNIKIHQAYLMITILNYDNDNEFPRNDLIELSNNISFIIQNLTRYGKTK